MKTKISHHKWIKIFLSALIPLMIAIFTVITTIQQQKMSTLQRAQDKQDALLLRQQSEYQANNLHQENIYATYLDDVSKLLLLNDEKVSLMQIRAKTLSSLRQLNSERKKHLFLFLYDSELIYYPPQKNISSLLRTSDADFHGIYIQGTTEASCSFIYLYLHDVYLSNASFINCYIDRSNLSLSTMYKTVFFKTRFVRTSFKFSLLDKSNFNQATFFEVDFTGASLTGCNFTGTYWMDRTVDFTNANLTGAFISNEQLSKSIAYNSVLPDGTWGPIRTKNLVINGDAEQNSTKAVNINITNWHVSVFGIISIIPYENPNFTKKFGKYYFRVTPSYNLSLGVSMYQNISLENFTLLISTGIARYNASVIFQCSGDQFGYIEVYFSDLNGLHYRAVYRQTKTKNQLESITISNAIHFEVRKVRLKIAFIKDRQYNNTNTTMDENYCIADNIEFSVAKAK